MREVTLLGQNVNAYCRRGRTEPDAWTLARLVYDPGSKSPKLERIRYTTSHPNDMADDLIAAHGALPQLMPYLHLPVQSGSDRVLKAMNRPPHRRRLPSPGGPPARRPPRPRALQRLHRRLSRARPTPSSRTTLRLVGAGRLRLGLLVQVLAAPGHPGGGRTPGRWVSPSRPSGWQRLNALLDAQRHAFDRAQVGATLLVLWEKAGRHHRPARRQEPLPAGGVGGGERRRPDRHDHAMCAITAARVPTVWSARLSPRPPSLLHASPLEPSPSTWRGGDPAVRRRGRARRRRAGQPPRGADRERLRRAGGNTRRRACGSLARLPGRNAARRAIDRIAHRVQAGRGAWTRATCAPPSPPPAPERGTGSGTGSGALPVGRRGGHRGAEDGRAGAATSTRLQAKALTFGIGPAGTGKTFLAVSLRRLAADERARSPA